MSARALAKFQVAFPSERMGSPVVAYKDKLVAGKKVRRHEKAGNDLDMAAYEKIIRSFGQPDYELWDTRNDHLLLVYDMGGGKVAKLSVAMTSDGAEVVSGFYVPMENILGSIKGGEYFEIK